jgi:hypothetical protein
MPSANRHDPQRARSRESRTTNPPITRIARIALFAALLAPAGGTAADEDGIEAQPPDAAPPASSFRLELPPRAANGATSFSLLAGVDSVGPSVGVRAAVGHAGENVRLDAAATVRFASGEFTVARGTIELIVSRASGAVRPWVSAGLSAAAAQLDSDYLFRLCLKNGTCYPLGEIEGESAATRGPELAAGIVVPLTDRALLGLEARFPFANEVELAGARVSIGGPYLGVSLWLRTPSR